jgi:hypothetical protein
MKHAEQEYITLCKQLIEQKFQFQNGGESLRQRDFEYLADSIEEKSGIKISLSTLKRLWKPNYDHTPHPSTLDGLVAVLGYKDWQQFKLQHAITSTVPKTTRKHNHKYFNLSIGFSILIALGVVFWLIAFRSAQDVKTKPLVKGPIIFTGNKTVDQGVPSTVIFNYDVSNVIADSFFFQQAWNEKERVKIDPRGHYYSNVYYYPGFHKAKLVANDSIIQIFKVHITTNGWMPLVRYSFDDRMPMYLKNSNGITGGALHIKKDDLIASEVNVDKDFLVSYYNVRDFENTLSDNFSLDTRIVSDSIGSIPCPGVLMTVICENNIFFVRLMGKGCEGNIAVQMGEVYQEGTNNDLSALSRDLYQWHRLQIKIVDKHATIYLDEQPVYNTTFKNDFGKVVGLVYNFAGTGAVDYVKLENGVGKLVYEDEFDK